MRVSSKRLSDAIEKAQLLLEKMTLVEKVGQLSQFGTSIYNDHIKYYEEHYENGKIGSYLTVKGADITNSVQKNAIENIPHNIPVLFGEDVIHGYRTTFPIPLAQSCSWNPDLVRLSSEISAKEAYCAGIKWVFSPMVDVALDPRWGRISEGYGEDPVLTSRFSAAAVEGYEGKEIGEKYHVISCLKHFAAYGACIGGRDYNAADISLQTLYETYLPPFKAGIDAGCTTLMTGFNSLNGVPCTGNSMLLKKILRDEWSFDGFVVSDCDAVGNLVPHGFAEDDENAALEAFLAGVDMNMAGEYYNENLPKLVSEGKISEKDIDESVLRILTVKYLLGLFDNPYVDNKEESCHFCDKHIKAAEQVAEESIVLLENKSKTLPLNNSYENIAVVGPLADDNTIVLGAWTCFADESRTITILDGIKDIAGGFANIKYSMGCSNTKCTDDDERLLSEAISVMRDSDVIILALGELGNESGEAKCKTSLRLYDNQQRLWKEAYKTGKPVIVLISAGRPLIFEELKDKAAAIMYIWQLGTCTGSAVAKALFGQCNPSGHLSTTFPHTEGQIPLNYNYTNTGHPALGLFWYESKYLDAPIEPDYCFGYGLSYTEFELSDLKLSSDKIARDGQLTVKCHIKNNGDYDGKAVIQLYVRDLVAKCVRPVKQLKDFTKLMLKVNETAEVSFTLNAADLGYYDSELNYVVEPGKFELFIGQNCYDKSLITYFVIYD